MSPQFTSRLSKAFPAEGVLHAPRIPWGQIWSTDTVLSSPQKRDHELGPYLFRL